MKIVINIPEEIYKDIMIHNREMREGGKSAYYFEGLIQNGTPLPKGCGRLGDLDALEKEMKFEVRQRDTNAYGCVSLVRDAKTIIEADEEW